jgi:hypothetical protein
MFGRHLTTPWMTGPIRFARRNPPSRPTMEIGPEHGVFDGSRVAAGSEADYERNSVSGDALS